MVSAAILLTIGGMLTVLATCPLKRVAWPFVRLLATLTLGLAIMVGAWFVSQRAWDPGQPGFWAFAAAVVAGAGSFVLMVLAPLLPQRDAIAGWLRGCAILCGVCALGGGLTLELGGQTTLQLVAAAIGLLLAAFVLGSFNVSWLLGHRYLTAPDMTIDPLRWMSGLTVVAMAARWLFFLVALGVILLVQSGGDASQALARDWLMVAIRISVGLLLPTIGAWMAWDCVRLRSTQSATGILFFTSVLIIIGELTSLYLAGPLGVAI